jgi:hypothetical protein
MASDSSLRLIAPRGASPEADAAAMGAAAPRFLAMAQQLNASTQPKPTIETFSVMIPGVTGEPDARSKDFFLIVEMPLESAALRAAFADELAGLYALSGEAGIGALEAGVRLVAAMNTQPDVPNKLPLEHSWRVIADLDSAIRDFRKNLGETHKNLEAAAAECALADLTLAREEIVGEAMRYLAMTPRTPRAAVALLESSAPAAQVILRGPGVLDLAGATLRIHRALGGTARPAQQGQRRATGTPPSGIMDFLLPPATAGDTVEDRLEESLATLMQLVTLRCRQHPLLHRIWRDNPLDSAVEIVERAPGEVQLVGRTKAASLALGRFSAAAYSVLRESYAANQKLAADLASDASRVWMFAPLLERALATDGFAADPVARQVAAASLAEAQGMSTLSKASLAASGAELAAGAAAAAPPVLIVLASAIAILSLVDLVNEFQANRTRQAAAHAVLDPSRSAGEEPGLLGLMLAVAFTLLDLKSVRDAARAARVASEIAAAERGVAMVLP